MARCPPGSTALVRDPPLVSHPNWSWHVTPLSASKTYAREACTYSDIKKAVLRVLDPGSGAFLTSWIRDPPGWVRNQDPDPGFGINIPDHISKSLETFFWVKNN
jgi:hypothetical protein